MKQNKCDVFTLIKTKRVKKRESCASQYYKDIQESTRQHLVFQPGGSFYTD
jgi:hypothetical protein